MRHALNPSFDAGEFGEDVIAPLAQAWHDDLPVRVSLRDACEPHQLVGLVERIFATFAFVVINGREVPIPAIRAVEMASLVESAHRCGRPMLARRHGRRRFA